MNTSRCYSELSKLETFIDRFEYLKLTGRVGEETFGYDRWLNQYFYTTPEWKAIRREVIIRDCNCDLGIIDRPIYGRTIIHHMNPITEEDILEHSDQILIPEFLICVCDVTHNAIHYGSFESLMKDPVVRRPNDTCPWKDTQ